jgi:hypothetical protein
VEYQKDIGFYVRVNVEGNENMYSRCFVKDVSSRYVRLKDRNGKKGKIGYGVLF